MLFVIKNVVSLPQIYCVMYVDILNEKEDENRE
jgi:hypothetical protein